MSFLDVLVKQNKLNVDQRAEAQTILEEGGNLNDFLTKIDINELDVLWAKGIDLNVPVRVIETDVDPDILAYIPKTSAEHYKIVPIGIKNGVLEIGMVEPDNLETKDIIYFIASKHDVPYKIFLISGSSFEKVLNQYDTLDRKVDAALEELESEFDDDLEKVSVDFNQSEVEDVENVDESEAPVTKITASLIRYAVDGGASDIHVEHMGKDVRVRYRVDGTLHTSLTLPAKIHSAIIARIKILSNMRLDEKRKPQDGRFSAHLHGRKVDFRVSTLPSYYGEKVVMRVLDSDKGIKTIHDVGLNQRDLELILESVKRPYGMILISGPTGSGKSTTLYSMLNELDSDTKNILSLEDPVEYNIPGITQSQVRPEIGYTFANGLRTTLRQDPDIIMVGEIRDKETAQLAIQAALTGHLVISTIHTNNAAGVVPRLVDMGVEPYLIAPTLILAIAQRLSKRLCKDAAEELEITEARQVWLEKEMENIPEDVKSKITIPESLYEAGSSTKCPSGTKGRIAVFEVLDINEDMERLILHGAEEEEIMEQARKDGTTTVREDAFMKSLQGLIPVSEVNKL